MTNEHYLIVSYFLFGLLSLALGLAAYRVLRHSFAAIAEAVASLRATMLRRTLVLSLALAAFLGFISVDYRGGCGKPYEDTVNDRGYLHQINRQQLQHAGNLIVFTVLVWAFLMVILLGVWRRKKEEASSGEQPRSGGMG
jgi:hypothetical protein